jgi:hypothetical protein
MTELVQPRPRRSLLTVATEISVLVTVAVLLGRMGYEALKPPPPPPPHPKVGGMLWTSHANNNVAHFGFTNLTSEVRVACMKGVVTAIQSKVSIESSVVCTGDVKPNTTMNLEASWPKGSPEDICYKEGTFGKLLDWSKCEFTHVEVAPVFQGIGAGPAGPAVAAAAASSVAERP